MARLPLLLAFAVLLCSVPAFAEDDEYSDSDSALLVVRKSIAGTNELHVLGRNVTVELTVYNAGAA